MRHYGRLTKMTEEGLKVMEECLYGMLHASRAKLDLKSDGTGSFMRFYIYHAQPIELKVLPACLGALVGFSSANNRGLLAL